MKQLIVEEPKRWLIPSAYSAALKDDERKRAARHIAAQAEEIQRLKAEITRLEQLLSPSA